MGPRGCARRRMVRSPRMPFSTDGRGRRRKSDARRETFPPGIPEESVHDSGHEPCTSACFSMTGPPGTPPITAGYDAETRALCRHGAEAACLLAILLVPPFALLDYIVCRQCFSLFLGMRL